MIRSFIRYLGFDFNFFGWKVIDRFEQNVAMEHTGKYGNTAVLDEWTSEILIEENTLTSERRAFMKNRMGRFEEVENYEQLQSWRSN